MERPAIGGQAVIEGVMMKSPKYYSVAVRKPDGKIEVRSWRYKGLAERFRLFKMPFFRGIIGMYDMLKIGIKSLNYSSSVASDDEGLSDKAAFATIAVAFVLAIGIFVLLPYFLTSIIGISEQEQPAAFNLVDGAIKVALFLAYIYAISYMEDVRRTFQYHGAEHMAVNCFESGNKITNANVQKFGTYHKRCGTSFIMIVFITMIVLFSFIPFLVYSLLPAIKASHPLMQKAILFMIRMLFIVPVAGISYELLRLSFRLQDNFLLRLISYPGKLFQNMTAKTPSKEQIDVAIAALNEALRKEGYMNKA